MADQNDGAGVVPEPLGSELVDQDGDLVNVVRMHTGSTSGPIIRPEGLGLPAPEQGWVDEASDEVVVDLLGELQASIVCNKETERSRARTYREILEQEGPGGPGGVGFRANAGNRAGKSSARVYGFGDFTFEYNSLTGDVTVTSRTDFLLVEPTKPGQARLTSKRRQGQPGVGIG